MTMPISPPHAQTIPCTLVCHGETVVDEYAWLRNKEDPAVIAYLEAENEYACRKLERVRPLQEKLFIEMLGRVQMEDSSVPERRGNYLYYWQTAEDRPYRTFYRRHCSHDAPEELLLDENVLAEGHAYYRIETVEPSPDGALLAFTVDTTGEQTFTLQVKDLGSGILLHCEVAAVGYSLVWAEDN
jgi:oligopeptidase B